MNRKKSKKQNSINLQDVESIDRKAFTQGWSQSLEEREALPIIMNGKIVKVSRKQAKSHNPGNQNEELDFSIKENHDKKDSLSVNENGSNKSDKKKEKENSQNLKFTNLSKTELESIKKLIGNICVNITTNPERGFKTKKDIIDEEEEWLGITDLFNFLNSDSIQVVELSMISLTLLFKDICPSYKIRSPDEYDMNIKLKKETKKLKDFELSILDHYKKFLKFLFEKTEKFLGDVRTKINNFSLSQKFGFNALKCQCELIKNLDHFNFSSNLIESISARAVQACGEIRDLCCQTLNTLIKNDKLGEVSYEVVKFISKSILQHKYNVHEKLLQCLSNVKLTVHADESKKVHLQAKRERKKRKNKDALEDAELGYLESNATPDEAIKKKFQADSLTEICLIYFRIIKLKMGFDLLPQAFDGLGRITHLMNMDMVEDLIKYINSLLESNSTIPVHIRIECIRCALRTLSGPGQELKMDDDIYMSKLKHILVDLSNQFYHWEALLDCLDFAFIKKREERSAIVLNFIKLLIYKASHLKDEKVILEILNKVHLLLLRYPRIRNQILSSVPTKLISEKNLTTININNYITEDEDQVSDLAMKALKESLDDSNANIMKKEEEYLSNNSLISAIICFLQHQKLNKIIKILLSKEIQQMPKFI